VVTNIANTSVVGGYLGLLHSPARDCNRRADPGWPGLVNLAKQTFKLALGPVNFAESGAGSIFSEP